MTGSGSPIERLRRYLQSLSPDARAMLIVELERSILRQEDADGGELVLQELRRLIRAAGQPAPRIGNAARRFFTPLEPFLIDGPADHKRTGRLARVSLAPIWSWIGRDLMPAEARTLSEDINRALLTEDRLKVEQLVSSLHDSAVQRLNAVLPALQPGEKAHRRFSVEVGTPRAVEDVTTLMRILALREPLAEMARLLPDHFRAFARGQVDQVREVFDGPQMRKWLRHGPAQGSELIRFGLILVTDRLTAPWQLIRIATCAAESDDAARIAATPYAPAVDIALDEIEHKVSELRTELKAGRPVASLLKAMHDAARGMRAEIDLSVDSTWSRRLAAICSMVSNLLTAEIETTPGRVRRLLRLHQANEIVAGSRLDAIDVHETESRVELVCACRHYADELAVSEVTLRAYSDLSHYLEASTRRLLDALGPSHAAERPFRQSQLDVAVRFCRTLFGADYAGQLAKAAGVAAQGAAAEPKAARA